MTGMFYFIEIECPPAPTTGTYERLSQPPSEDNYAVPPELGMRATILYNIRYC